MNHFKSSLALFMFSLLSISSFAKDSSNLSILKEVQQAYNAIAKQCIPAVVSVSVEGEREEDVNRFGASPYDFFERFFGQSPQSPSEKSQKKKRKRKTAAFGSGFLISKDGYLISNYHVVEGAKKIKVKFYKREQSYKAKVIGLDKDTDLALLKIEGKNFPYLRFANSDKINIGDIAIAIGNPFSFSFTFTKGVISAKGRKQLSGGPTYQNFIQTDVAINPGNSGGPLLNYKGEVIGVNSMIFSQSGGSLGIGFAIPSNLVKKIKDELKENGSIVRGWLGISIQDVSEDMQEALDLKQNGVYVPQVFEDSPAKKAGLKAGDIIVEYNGSKVQNSSELMNNVANTKPGEKIKIAFYRQNKLKTLEVKVGKKAEETTHKPTDIAENPLGIRVKTQKTGNQFVGVEIIDISPSSPLTEKRVYTGDVITMINYREISDMEDYKRQIKKIKKGKKVLLHINRDGYLFPVAVKAN